MPVVTSRRVGKTAPGGRSLRPGAPADDAACMARSAAAAERELNSIEHLLRFGRFQEQAEKEADRSC